jgi:hypothetical protein
MERQGYALKEYETMSETQQPSLHLPFAASETLIRLRAA